MIRLTIPSIEEDDLEAVRRVLSTGQLVQGFEVAQFERQIADYVGTKHGVAVSNCTAALHLSLLALDVRPGDIVVATSYSWISTANVIELVGAQPVFTDISESTFNMDPQSLSVVLRRLMSSESTGRRVKAILPVHTFGLMADMPEILKIAGEYSIPVIEDAACALGADIGGRQAGTWGRIGCFSFHPRKAITTGEGGVAVTDDDGLAWKLRALRNHGLDPLAPAPDFVMPGFNYRLTEFQAALGITQLAKLDRIFSARQHRAALYDRMLADSELRAPVAPAGHRHVFQSYVCLLPAGAAAIRLNLISALKVDAIESTIGTIHMPLTTYFRNRYDYRPGDFPVTDSVAARSLTLPLHEHLDERSQRRVVAQLSDSLTSAEVRQGTGQRP